MSEGAHDGRFIGEIGISMAVEALLRSGFYVAVPIIDDGYDLIAVDGRRYWRIQVKATAARGQNSGRCRIKRGGDKLKDYCPLHVDAFILVQVRTGRLLCVPVSEAAGRSWFPFGAPGGKWDGVEPLRRIRPVK